MFFGGAGYLRIAAAPYNTADDYRRLAGAVRELPGRLTRSWPRLVRARQTARSTGGTMGADHTDAGESGG